MSHRTAREPTDEELEELDRTKRQEISRVAMRAHMVLLSDRGRPPSEIADLHAVSHPTVYRWTDRFDEEGPSGLYDREREGRPRGLSKEARKEIERLLEGNLSKEGQNAARWSDCGRKRRIARWNCSVFTDCLPCRRRWSVSS